MMFNKLLEEFEKNVPSSEFKKVELSEADLRNFAEPELRQRLARRLQSIAEKLEQGNASSAYEELYGDTGLNWLAPSIKALADNEDNDS